MSVDPTDCPECSGFHLGWREGPPPCAADDGDDGPPILAPLTDWERELLVRHTQDAPGTPRYTTADENASTDDGPPKTGEMN